jgi:hypothetical protein
MYRIFTISALNVISLMVVTAILIYRRYVKKKLGHLAGSGRLTEIGTMELRKEYCLMWISVIFLINFMAKLIALN